jgi:pSer/pThr/pTyr-binding forkhead associated (FHA) protein
VDLGSTNGVKVNGRRIQGPQSLRPGDDVQLGTAHVGFEAD